MPAQVDQMFSVREMPWHREGDVLDDYPQTFEEARKRAGLMWDPVGIPAVMRLHGDPEMRDRFREIVLRSPAQQVGRTVDDLMELYQASVIPDRDFRRIARSDTRVSLSYQRESYNIIPNSAFGEIIDGIVQAGDGQVKLETGGSLAGGRKVWMLARLGNPVHLPGDGSPTFPYLAVTSSHDGHASCAARLTTVRIVCANTFDAAEAEGKRTGLVYAFSHRGDYRQHLEEAREALRYGRDQFRRYADVMGDLAVIKVTPAQRTLFVREFIPAPPDGIMSDRTARNIAEARAAVEAILDGPTVEGSGIGGTAYGLVQAAGEYLDHVRIARTWESRVGRSLLRTEKGKARAVKLAREAALAA